MNGNPGESQQFSIIGYGMGWLRTSFKGHEVRELCPDSSEKSSIILALHTDAPARRRHPGILSICRFLPE